MRPELEEFYRAVGALRGADKTVLSEVAKGMRKVARPVVADIRTEVRSSKGHSERKLRASEIERQLHVLGRAGKRGVPLTERQVRSTNKRLAVMSSLRANIASATGASVSAGEKKTALAFRVSARQLPPSQRKLPRRWDNESGWRHPVFGNRNNWVKQVGHPYFRKTIYERRDVVTAAVVDAMDAAAARITHPDTGATP